MVTRSEEIWPAARGGLGAGLLGGVAMWLFVVLCAALAGRDLWVDGGEVQLDMGTRPVLIGLVLHLAVSLVWGLLFGLFAYGLSGPRLLLAGIGWGMATWIVMFYVALPLAGLGSAATRQSGGMIVFEHLLFGLGLAVGMPATHRRHLPHGARTSMGRHHAGR